MTLFAFMVFTFAVVPAMSQANETAKKRAEELLAKARAAIGDEAKIKAVKSLSLAGKLRRSSAGGQIDAETEIGFMLPDKFIKSETMNSPVGAVTVVFALAGDVASFNTISPSEKITFGGFAQKDADEAKPAFRAESVRWILGLLFAAPNLSAAGFAYEGEADIEGSHADIVDVTGANGFKARLFLDSKTHRLNMMSYTGKLRKTGRGRIQNNSDGTITEEGGAAAQKIVGMDADTVRVRFSDYRAVEGVQFPHRVVFQSGEGIKEEYEFAKIQINPKIAPELFKKKA